MVKTTVLVISFSQKLVEIVPIPTSKPNSK